MQWNVQPGAKGLKSILGRVPTWVSVSHSEKCEVCPARCSASNSARNHLERFHLLNVKSGLNLSGICRLWLSTMPAQQACARGRMHGTPASKQLTALQSERSQHLARVCVQWINAMLLEMWPYYDIAVCDMLKVRFFQLVQVRTQMPATATISKRLCTISLARKSQCYYASRA